MIGTGRQRILRMWKDGSFVSVRSLADPPIPRREWGSSIIHVVLVFFLSVTYTPRVMLTSFFSTRPHWILTFCIIIPYYDIRTQAVCKLRVGRKVSTGRPAWCPEGAILLVL
jgi:hypothetical protein